MMHITRYLPLTLALAATSLADVRVPRIFGDHMVLQRETDIAVWGWADAGEAVTVSGSWGTESATTEADDDGRWSVQLSTPGAGGPYTVSIRGVNEVRFEDVMCGEVWICSGQSNMQWGVRQCNNAEAEIAAADHPSLRLFTVQRTTAMEPEDDVSGAWVACSSGSIPGFSATGYFFGRALQEELDVPIGLISTNWGGTVAEAWTSAETLRSFPEFGAPLNQIQVALSSPNTEKTLQARQASWWGGLVKRDPGQRGAWMKPELDLGEWKESAVPGTFAMVGMGSFDGCMWYRRDVEVPAEYVDAELKLDLGPVDDMDLTYINGVLVGSTRQHGQWQRPRSYVIEPGVVRSGVNVITVCAVDTGGGGTLGVAGDVKPPMRLRKASAPIGSGVALEGTWMIRAGASMGELGGFPTGNWFHQNYPTALYNAMIAPLVPYGVRGAIWYQGESNRSRAAQYRRLFPAMITDWREKWGRGDFPFYYVQIAPYAYGGDQGEAAELREAQTMTMALSNTGMAVTMDIGNPRDIHPKNKEDVGRRLAAWALAKDYGRDVSYSGPLYESMVVVGDTARLHFSHTDGGLRSGEEALSHFTIAGEDQVFHPAQASIEGDHVWVRSDQVASPRAVRYAWGAADEPNLANAAGFPSPSFRTDGWPPVSSDR